MHNKRNLPDVAYLIYLLKNLRCHCCKELVSSGKLRELENHEIGCDDAYNILNEILNPTREVQEVFEVSI